MVSSIRPVNDNTDCSFCRNPSGMALRVGEFEEGEGYDELHAVICENCARHFIRILDKGLVKCKP